ncbi:MAG TPA: hypothetical protein VGO56_10545 [Pyrinomonadaceae bacterium]|jgi:hypothetical protein|nr:hypothetical protein [Pyrinomonadaceae bacterium]
MDACQKNIQQFLDRQLEQWSGLVSGCQESNLQSWLAFKPGEGRTYLGTERVTYSFRSLSQPRFENGVFFYFQEDLLSFIATDHWSFDRQECVDLRQSLGEPAHRLDFYWRNLKIESGEFVYADKGISLGIVPDTELIVSVVVFPPCTLHDYKSKYYNITLAREFNPDE